MKTTLKVNIAPNAIRNIDTTINVIDENNLLPIRIDMSVDYKNLFIILPNYRKFYIYGG